MSILASELVTRLYAALNVTETRYAPATIVGWLKRGATDLVQLAITGDIPWNALAFIEAEESKGIADDGTVNLSSLASLVIRDYLSVNGRPVSVVRSVSGTPRYPSAVETDHGNYIVHLIGDTAATIKVKVTPTPKSGSALKVRYVKEPRFVAAAGQPDEKISEPMADAILAFGIIVGAREIGDGQSESLGIRMRDEAVAALLRNAR